MDCNKEEALRAKGVAEKKMQNKDFVGARKIALRAQQLYPDLENITQILAVCEVHCSAERKVSGSEMDWYGILQIAQTADEAAMKKQYRKLALLLHPDKNKFAGAEAAFKLIGEAHRVLSNPKDRSLYDLKCRVPVRTTVSKPPQQQQTKNSYVKKQCGVNSNFVNSTTTQFTKMSFQQQQPKTQSSCPIPNGKSTFWTACPACTIRYQYYTDVVNRSLRCPTCSHTFVAYDLGPQAVPPVSGWNAVPPGAHKVNLQNNVPGAHKINLQNNVQNNSFGMGFRGPGGAASAPEQFPKAGGTAAVGPEPNSKKQADMEVGKDNQKKGKKRSKVEDEKLKTSKKRRNTLEAESSENCGRGSSTDSGGDETFGEKGAHPTEQNGGGHYPRRSVRQKQNVTYDENLSDDDFASSLKRSGGNGSLNVTNDQNGASFMGAEEKKVETQKEGAPLKESFANRNNKAEACKQNGKEAPAVEDNAEGSDRDRKFSSSASCNRKPDPETFVVPDPDFYDFDKDRKEECFASDQLWAVYDTTDSMPRFYARIKKVFSGGFKVRITWLEADPDDLDEIAWFHEDLPVSCGKFRLGDSEITEDLNMFSHLVYKKTACGGSYKVYPKMGETWAIFKNWDRKWSSDPENHRSYEFEFVVVLSDYADGSSIRVAHLVKVKGFVSLFGLKKRTPLFEIPLNELFRFSHRVPSYKTTGAEREGLSEGYFELDPASLPERIEESDPKDVEVVSKNLYSKISKSCSESADTMKGGPKSNVVTEDYGVPPSPSVLDPPELPDPEFYDFEADKTPEKFRPGQIWALYCEYDGMPKYYARITKVNPHPDFKLYITWLEPERPPKDIIQWSKEEMPICCGTFRQGSAEVFTGTKTFSHLSNANSSGRNKYEIIPRKGEIWALYKNFSSEWTCSDLINCEYDIVEIIDIDIKMTRVVILELVDGFDTVFKAQGSRLSIMEIPQIELLRFSHKVPAFQLTAERDGCLKGFWELDPKSIPVCSLRFS